MQRCTCTSRSRACVCVCVRCLDTHVPVTEVTSSGGLSQEMLVKVEGFIG